MNAPRVRRSIPFLPPRQPNSGALRPAALVWFVWFVVLVLPHPRFVIQGRQRSSSRWESGSLEGTSRQASPLTPNWLPSLRRHPAPSLSRRIGNDRAGLQAEADTGQPEERGAVLEGDDAFLGSGIGGAAQDGGAQIHPVHQIAADLDARAGIDDRQIGRERLRDPSQGGGLIMVEDQFQLNGIGFGGGELRRHADQSPQPQISRDPWRMDVHTVT